MGKESVWAPGDVPFAWRGLELQEAGCPRSGVCLAAGSCSTTEQLQSCIFSQAWSLWLSAAGGGECSLSTWSRSLGFSSSVHLIKVASLKS